MPSARAVDKVGNTQLPGNPAVADVLAEALYKKQARQRAAARKREQEEAVEAGLGAARIIRIPNRARPLQEKVRFHRMYKR
jgi:hypothetical protein